MLVTALVAWYATSLTERLAMSSLALVIVGAQRGVLAVSQKQLGAGGRDHG